MKKQFKKSLALFACIFALTCLPAVAAANDAEITKEVNKVIMNYHDVKATSHNGVVTLSGKVASEQDRLNLAAVAEKVPGVKSVENKLLVDSTANLAMGETQDLQTSKTVIQRLDKERALDGTLIRVSTMRGAVTLSGKVDTAEQSALAAKLAAGVQGVKSVDNQLAVRPGYTTSTQSAGNMDMSITRRANQLLKEYNYTDVQASTTNRIVTLSGVVPTTKDRDNAAELVNKIEGVTSVDNKIMAQADLSQTQSSDMEITRVVRAAIEADPNIDPINSITIFTSNGVVTLNGKVGIPENIKQAEQDAAMVPGVKGVKNQLGFYDF